MGTRSCTSADARRGAKGATLRAGGCIRVAQTRGGLDQPTRLPRLLECVDSPDSTPRAHHRNRPPFGNRFLDTWSMESSYGKPGEQRRRGLSSRRARRAAALRRATRRGGCGCATRGREGDTARPRGRCAYARRIVRNRVTRCRRVRRLRVSAYVPAGSRSRARSDSLTLRSSQALAVPRARMARPCEMA